MAWWQILVMVIWTMKEVMSLIHWMYLPLNDVYLIIIARFEFDIKCQFFLCVVRILFFLSIILRVWSAIFLTSIFGTVHKPNTPIVIFCCIPSMKKELQNMDSYAKFRYGNIIPHKFINDIKKQYFLERLQLKPFDIKQRRFYKC